MFILRVITPKRQWVDVDVSILNLRTDQGQIGLLKNHMPYVANVLESEMNYITADKKRHFVQISKGVIFFKDNIASLLVERVKEIEK